MKRIPRERLEAEIRMHQMAHLNMIRNWVGQSTSEDFYELCDKYGILVWDEFFQANAPDGPDPTDIDTYMANVRDKVLRYRNHPSIALWCARNESYPPPEIDADSAQAAG
jgi:beta-galactosidase/beta-glucuronidase